MVDFKKRLEKFGNEKLLNPIEIYDRLDRASDKGPLRPAQIAVLEDWHNNRRAQRDIILKLNTGQGKTLTGLLMLQSMMNENDGSSLYLCPNNLLVSQTVAQAKQFGITCVVPEGDLPIEFINGKNILVTSIHKLLDIIGNKKNGSQFQRFLSAINSKVMQTTSDDHDQIRKTIFRVAQHILHTSRTFDAGNRMFHADTHFGYFTVVCLFFLS